MTFKGPFQLYSMTQEWFENSTLLQSVQTSLSSLAKFNNCVVLFLQENLIGALLAIFGHLVSSIALNLQVSVLKPILILH